MAGVSIGRHIRQWLTWTVIVIIGYIAATYIVMGGLYLMAAVFPGEVRVTSAVLLGARAVTAVLTLAIAIAATYAMKAGRVTPETLGLGRLPLWKDLALTVAGAVVYVASATLLLSIARTFPFFDATQPQQLGSTALFGLERLVAFVALVVVIPFVEEVIFRGFMYGKLRESGMPFWPTALAVSVLFGVAHGQVNVGIDVFCMSMVACYLRNITGSIWAGVLLHMLKNAVAFMAVYVLAQGVAG